MVNDAGRDPIAYDPIWPTSLRQPDRPPRLLYLDLNHWIGLSRASTGRPGGERYERLLDALDAARRDRRVRVVLTAALYFEIEKNADPRQRIALADIIERLTEFEYLAGLADLMRLELTSVLDDLTDTSTDGWAPVELVGSTVLHAHGMKGGLNVFDHSGVNVTATQAAEGLDVAAMERQAERWFLEGPAAFDMDDMRSRGYRPEVVRQQFEDNLTIERQFADQLDDHWRRGRLRDILIGRDLYHEVMRPLLIECLERGIDVGDLMDDRDTARRLLISMPTRCVVIEMKTAYHRDANRRWKVNDLHDIDALANTVPYCDIVFADAAARSCLMRADLHTRMDTVLPRTPDELADILEGPGA